MENSLEILESRINKSEQKFSSAANWLKSLQVFKQFGKLTNHIQQRAFQLKTLLKAFNSCSLRDFLLKRSQSIGKKVAKRIF